MRADPLAWSRDGDATVEELEASVANMAGKPAGLFVPTGTMANTLAVSVLAEPGDSFVADRSAHILRAEGHSYYRVARLEPVLVEGDRGHPGPEDLQVAVESSARVSLLWLENTHTFAGGTVSEHTVDRQLSGIARDLGVRVHLDGSRLWNAAVAGGRSLSELAGVADTVVLNLSKGLGAPAGAVLCGPADVIESARELALALGGYVAQAGLLAAAGIASLRGYEAVIARDHELATRLATGLTERGVAVDEPQTNIVLVEVASAAEAQDRLQAYGVLAFVRDPTTIRFVTHRELGPEDIERVLALAEELRAGSVPAKKGNSK